MNKKQSQEVLDLIEDAIESAKMESAALSDELKEKVKLYNETWVLSPLYDAKQIIKNDLSNRFK